MTSYRADACLTRVRKMHNYHLLTGSPGSGKSALLRELQKLGYPTVNEPARQVLEEQRSFDGSGVPERSPELFTELMLSRAIALFKQMKGVKGPVFVESSYSSL